MKLFVSFWLLFLTLSLTLSAAEYYSGDVVKVAFSDSVNQDIFAGAATVEVFGFVDGDIYAGCENMTIEGKVADDVLVGCRRLIVNGIIADGIIFFGETLLINGTVHGDVMAFGKEVRISDQAKLNGNLYVACAELRHEGGKIAGFIKGGIGQAYLNGQIGQVVDIEVGDINFGENYAAAEGTYIKTKEDFDPEKLDYVPPDLDITFEEHRMFFQNMFFYWSFLAALVTGIILFTLFKDFSRDYLTFANKNLPLHTGFGFLLLIAVPVAVIILAIFLFTIPVALILLALYLIVVYLSTLFSSLYIGEYLMKLMMKETAPKSLIIYLLLGLMVVILLPQIPFIGVLFTLVFIALGAGSLIMYIWSLRQAKEVRV